MQLLVLRRPATATGTIARVCPVEKVGSKLVYGF